MYLFLTNGQCLQPFKNNQPEIINMPEIYFGARCLSPLQRFIHFYKQVSFKFEKSLIYYLYTVYLHYYLYKCTHKCRYMICRYIRFINMCNIVIYKKYIHIWSSGDQNIFLICICFSFIVTSS